MNPLLNFQNITISWSKYTVYSLCSTRKLIKIRGYVNEARLQKFSFVHFTRNYFTSTQNFNNAKHGILDEPISRICEGTDLDELKEKLEGISGKIIYNSVLEKNILNWKWRKMTEKKENKSIMNRIHEKDPISSIPIALKYLNSVETEAKNVEKEGNADSVKKIVHLPYNIEPEIGTRFKDPADVLDSRQTLLKSYIEEHAVGSNKEQQLISETEKWMSDYELYDELDDINFTNVRRWELNYGTPDIDVPMSNVPCGGCGALLHCQDTAIPGYLPSEIFSQQNEATLRSLLCQRCHFMRNYNTALNVIVSPDEYPKLMSHVKETRALIVLMIDLLDFPCSIWPGIMDIIGVKQPIIVVGNKVDLLPPDSKDYLRRIKNCLTTSLLECGIPAKNIKHISLISAKTGYGIEELITSLHNIWEYKGDVFLLGCTNVGKSTLFNALLQSDFCKVKAVDLIQRATTSPWPGTTINLLKFPILRPSGWRLYERTQRIKSTRHQINAENQLHYLQLKEKRIPTMPALIGHVGMTFYKKESVEDNDPFSMQKYRNQRRPLSGLDPSDKDFENSRWCYDTPGVVHPDQVINLLTTEELLLTLPKNLLLPRTFRLRVNMTLFIAGLGRLDYVQGDEPLSVTVFASNLLPITICKMDDADELYKVLLGSKILAVPKGGKTRLAQWPALVHSELMELEGIGWKESCGDILLSSAGWVAVTLQEGKKCTFQGWTPNGNGVHVRKPSVLPFAVNMHGRKKQNSPAYQMGRAIFRKHV